MKGSVRRAGRRAPLAGIAIIGVALVMPPAAGVGAEWTSAQRVSPQRGSRLDSLHQLAADRGAFHLLHPRVEPGSRRDRVVYQRSSDGGATWGRERVLYAGTAAYPNVIPNLAIDAGGTTVAAAWRSRGPKGTVLHLTISTNNGFSFGKRFTLAASRKGLGVPAVAVSESLIAVAWTERRNGSVKVRVSRDGGASFKKAVNVGRTSLSISCRDRVLDGLVGASATGRRIHVAWSHASSRACLASRLNVRSSRDRGKSWDRRRTITKRTSYGWPELDSRGRTVVATVQLPTGDLLVARSAKSGRAWQERVIKARKGHLLSAGDIVLLPKGRALLTYVDERVRKDRLVSTRVLARPSGSDARRFGSPSSVIGMARRLRMAPNVAATGSHVTIVFQSGDFDGSPRNVYAARRR